MWHPFHSIRIHLKYLNLLRQTRPAREPHMIDLLQRAAWSTEDCNIWGTLLLISVWAVWILDYVFWGKGTTYLGGKFDALFQFFVFWVFFWGDSGFCGGGGGKLPLPEDSCMELTLQCVCPECRGPQKELHDSSIVLWNHSRFSDLRDKLYLNVAPLQQFFSCVYYMFYCPYNL